MTGRDTINAVSKTLYRCPAGITAVKNKDVHTLHKWQYPTVLYGHQALQVSQTE